MKQLLILSALLLALIAGARSGMGQTQQATKFPSAASAKNSAYTYEIIPAPNKTYCYDIYQDKRLFIHQASKPGLPGNEGFKTKAAADTVARVVIGKIKKGEMPPSVSIEEMKKLKVL